ncbi:MULTISPECIES: 4-alpha-glucanotransferase [Cryobacterium]|uniref:4-alpha-glucanotransferase n=1 Tax=Cryobacterium breve TaxID=1259258 RepID=A0ABY2JAS2_9MICO|nr:MULTISPECIES: 4-alpha-glucanotransferase [Cryobacterium]TFC91156.1 4-alpha-glucanotransferase [Cryobacterium sp. TmT3-12]TFD01149.1 4-alpha-glucanotransferase [Cryobacterium breve]
MELDPTDRPAAALLELARSLGVDTTFTGWDGAARSVEASTLRAVLAALGVAAGTPAEIDASLTEQVLAPWRRLLPPVVVVREGTAADVPVHAHPDSTVRVWIIAEDGSRHDVSQQATPTTLHTVDGLPVRESTFVVHPRLPLGWHTLHAEADGREADCALVVTPPRLETTRNLAGHRDWGVMAQLYSVRSSRSWGIGDFADLADLATISGTQYGAGFVLVNPLHASEPCPPVEPSPYLPSSRRFFHPLYLRVEDVPEYAYLTPEARAVVESLATRQHPANLEAGHLDRDSAYAAKLTALETVHQVRRSAAREHRFQTFCAEQGQGLADFALWCALSELFPSDAPEWSVEPRGPRGPFAAANREKLADRIEFHCWLQWLCDQQLETAQRATAEAGMSIGIVHDLAVGVQFTGSDAWTLRDVLAPGMTVGAPPDMFNQQGQNWSQPPWHPGRLAESGYAAYRDMLRSILHHAGGIRVDHILGLFRLWWIPVGAGPGEGTYVHYDHEALIGILALEAQRAGAIVIGEDLGVFEPWVRDYLAERGIFGTSILWFEREADVPLAPERYRQACLTSVNTHDLPPTAGYLAGDHVALRESLGLLGRPVAEERAADLAEQSAMLAALRERGLLPPVGTEPAPTVQQTVEALYAYTALTPSSLLGVALVDAVGERRTQNQPGTTNEYPNWRVPLAGPDGVSVLIDDLATNPRFAALVEAIHTGS